MGISLINFPYAYWFSIPRTNQAKAQNENQEVSNANEVKEESRFKKVFMKTAMFATFLASFNVAMSTPNPNMPEGGDKNDAESLKNKIENTKAVLNNHVLPKIAAEGQAFRRNDNISGKTMQLEKLKAVKLDGGSFIIHTEKTEINKNTGEKEFSGVTTIVDSDLDGSPDIVVVNTDNETGLGDPRDKNELEERNNNQVIKDIEEVKSSFGTESMISQKISALYFTENGALLFDYATGEEIEFSQDQAKDLLNSSVNGYAERMAEIIK